MVVFESEPTDVVAPEDDRLVIRRGPAVRFGFGLVDRFVALSAAHDQATVVARFASRYGRLGLCRHGLPNRHHEHVIRIDDERDCWDSWGPEPLAAWLYWSRRAGAMLNLAGALRDRERWRSGERAARVLLTDDRPYPQGQVWAIQRSVDRTTSELWTRSADGEHRPRQTQRREWPGFLCSAWNEWVALAGIDSTVRWMANGTFERDLTYNDLFGLLGMLVERRLTSSGQDRRYTEVLRCQAPGCGVEFERWQPHGKAVYCRPCSVSGAAQRAAEAKYQEKRKALTDRRSSPGAN
jgi:hypothetical protein